MAGDGAVVLAVRLSNAQGAGLSAGRQAPTYPLPIRRSRASVAVAVGFMTGPASSAGLPSQTSNDGGQPGTVRHIVLTTSVSASHGIMMARWTRDAPLVLWSVGGAPTPVVGACMHVLSNLRELMALRAFPRKSRGRAPSGGWLGSSDPCNDARGRGSAMWLTPYCPRP